MKRIAHCGWDVIVPSAQLEQKVRELYGFRVRVGSVDQETVAIYPFSLEEGEQVLLCKAAVFLVRNSLSLRGLMHPDEPSINANKFVRRVQLNCRVDFRVGISHPLFWAENAVSLATRATQPGASFLIRRDSLTHIFTDSILMHFSNVQVICVSRLR